MMHTRMTWSSLAVATCIKHLDAHANHSRITWAMYPQRPPPIAGPPRLTALVWPLGPLALLLVHNVDHARIPVHRAPPGLGLYMVELSRIRKETMECQSVNGRRSYSPRVSPRLCGLSAPSLSFLCTMSIMPASRCTEHLRGFASPGNAYVARLATGAPGRKQP
jgi:hypothetical protein